MAVNLLPRLCTTTIANSHWITVSNIGCPAGHVQVFDSLPSGDVSLHSNEQISVAVHQGEGNYLGLSCSATPKVGSDCGVFAVAFVCTDDTTATITHQQPSLHRHLMEYQTLSPFSGVKKKSTRLRYSECFRVYCCCCQPENGKRMVECKGYYEQTMISS